MAASSSSQSSSESSLSPTDDTWADEPWFREHEDQAERFEAERRYWSAGLAPAMPTIAAQGELCPEDATNPSDDSSSDSSSDTDSLASVETISSERRRVQASLNAARVRIQELIAHYEQEALAGEDEADDLDEGEDLQGGYGAAEPLPIYEQVETPPPDYVAAVTAVVEEEAEVHGPQPEQVSLQELHEWEQQVEQRRQREERQEWIRWAADSRNAPEPLSEIYELQTYETGYERARAGRSSDDGFSSAMRQDRETLEMSGGDGASGRMLI